MTAQQVCGRFAQRQPGRSANTTTDGQSLYLHGNRIAWWNEDGSLGLSSCGWGTPTTKRRLNQVLVACQARAIVYSRHKRWYVHYLDSNEADVFVDSMRLAM